MLDAARPCFGDILLLGVPGAPSTWRTLWVPRLHGQTDSSSPAGCRPGAELLIPLAAGEPVPAAVDRARPRLAHGRDQSSALRLGPLGPGGRGARERPPEPRPPRRRDLPWSGDHPWTGRAGRHGRHLTGYWGPQPQQGPGEADGQTDPHSEVDARGIQTRSSVGLWL